MMLQRLDVTAELTLAPALAMATVRQERLLAPVPAAATVRQQGAFQHLPLPRIHTGEQQIT